MTAHLGVLVRDVDGRLECHVCGRAYYSLATHIRRTHDMEADEYKAQFGLNRTTPLLSDHMLKAVSRNVRRQMSEGRWPVRLGSKTELDQMRKKVPHQHRAEYRLKQSRLIRENAFFGKRTRPKLTLEQVAEIRALLDQGVIHRVIADKYGVSRGLIAQIACGYAWRDDRDHSWVNQLR